MEKSVSLPEAIRESFGLKEIDHKTYSPLTLAFIGDCVFDLIVRTMLVAQGNRPPGQLDRQKRALVRAKAQADFATALLPQLTPEEMGVYKRGRNAHSHTIAKNATVADYRKATGLEALIGYLYLTNRLDRALELVQKSLETVGS